MARYVALQSLPAGTLTDVAGNALPGRSVNVFLHGTTTPATVYPNPDGSGAPYTQPLRTIAAGAVPGYVLAEQTLDVVDVLTGASLQAEAISALDISAPPNVEVVTNKNQPSGYAGLDGGGKLLLSEMPVLDGGAA